MAQGDTFIQADGFPPPSDCSSCLKPWFETSTERRESLIKKSRITPEAPKRFRIFYCIFCDIVGLYKREQEK